MTTSRALLFLWSLLCASVAGGQPELSVSGLDGGFVVHDSAALDGGSATLEPPVLTRPSPATYPAGLSGVTGTVRLELLLSEAGAVETVSVIASDDARLDDAAVSAARGLLFAPARLDGTPVKVRLTFDYAFVAPPPRGILQGQVRIRGDQSLVTDAVLVEGEQPIVAADESGRFSVELPPGPHSIEVRSPGRKPLRVEETIVADDTVTVVYRLEPLVSRPYESVVRDERPRTEVSRHSLAEEELREVPGTMGDPFRVVMLLPGVSAIASGISYPVVRGSQPAATGYFVDGVQVPVLFHVALGPSVVHPEFIDGLSFHPGVAPVQYGRLLGGVVDGQVSRPREDRFRLAGYADLVNAGLFVETPIPATGTTVTLAGRFSYTGLLAQTLGALVLGADGGRLLLNFWDYQGRIEQRLPWGGKLRLLALGSSDAIGSEFPGEERFKTLGGLSFHRVDLRYEQPLGAGTLELGGTWGVEGVGFDARSKEQLLLDYSLRSQTMRARARWNARLLPAFTISAGADVEHRRGRSTIAIGLPPSEPLESDPVSVSFNQPLTLSTFTGAYLEGIWTPSAAWTIAVGARADAWHLVPRIDRFSLDPRLGVHYRPLEQLALKAGAAIVHQPPTVLLNVPIFEVAGLRYTLQEATKFDAGAEWSPLPGLEVSLDAFYADLNRTLEFDLFQLIQNESTLGLFAPELITHGRSYGLELMLRHRIGAGWFGWLSYSLQRSTRVETFVRFDASGNPTGVERGEVDFAFDQRHVLNAALSYQFPGNLTAGVTLHFNTGRPESGRISSRTQVQTHGEEGTPPWRLVSRDEVDRLPSYLRVDARVAKKWLFDEFQLEAYLDVMNLLVAQEVVGFNYCPSRACFDGLGSVYKAPIAFPVVLPMLGLKGTY